ncbi:hypothetical protein Emag_003762 [Eimeria magna]
MHRHHQHQLKAPARSCVDTWWLGDTRSTSSSSSSSSSSCSSSSRVCCCMQGHIPVGREGAPKANLFDFQFSALVFLPLSFTVGLFPPALARQQQQQQ